MSLVLHPAYKTQYFVDHEWQPDWVEETLRLIREEWEKFYKPTTSEAIKREDDDDTQDSEPVIPSQASELACGRNRHPGHLSARATMDVSLHLHASSFFHTQNS